MSLIRMYRSVELGIEFSQVADAFYGNPDSMRSYIRARVDAPAAKVESTTAAPEREELKLAA